MIMSEIGDGNWCFGSPAQQSMERTAHWLWPLLRSDPAYGYMGRSVSLEAVTPDSLPVLATLARLQGASLSHFVSREDEPELAAAFSSQGLVSDRWDQFMGTEACLETCARVVRGFELPDCYCLREIGPDTETGLYAKLAETALACHVLPPISAVISGQNQQAICFVLEAPDGGVAACSAAVLGNHIASPWGRAAWWGMLATREKDRGQSLSLYLGALAALRMNERFGAEIFYTGVRPENAVSRHICGKLGVSDSGLSCLAVIDPAQFGEGAFTK